MDWPRLGAILDVGPGGEAGLLRSSERRFGDQTHQTASDRFAPVFANAVLCCSSSLCRRRIYRELWKRVLRFFKRSAGLAVAAGGFYG